ncbi:hypothetical protein Tco_0472311 [Tanacetum coccineum]
MDESEKVKTKIKLQQEQERLDFEAAMRLQAKVKEEERQRIARVHEAASSFNVEEWEDIQARVESDEELVQRLQAEEREKYTKAEQARMLAELINQRKRYFAAQRAEERRNKPPTQAQQRTYMSNYIKNMGGYTLQQLRGYSFDEIKTLFETSMRRVNIFVPIESKVDREVLELAAGSSKRDAEEELDQESSKRQKTGESSKLAEEPRDKEADELSQEELQQIMIIVPEQGMNVEALQTKEGNRHLHAGREGVSIVKGNSYIDVGRKALAKESILSWDQQTTLPPPPPLLPQSTTDPDLATRVCTLEKRSVDLENKTHLHDKTTQALASRVYKLEHHDLYSQIDKQVNKVIKEVVHNALQAPLHECFRDLSKLHFMNTSEICLDHTALYEALEASMQRDNNDELHADLTKSRKRRHDDQDPHPPPPKDSDQSKKKKHDYDVSASKQPLVQKSPA